MYLLLFILHTIFIAISHFLGYYILEGVFFLFLVFFLLYFSPIFFSKKDQDFPTFSVSNISFSIQDSLILPMWFFYTAVFSLLYAVTQDFSQSFDLNIFFAIVVYVIFFLYMTAFEWKNDMFFDITKIHMIFSYAILFIVVFLSFFSPTIISLPVIGLLLSALTFSYIYFFHARKEDVIFFQGFLMIVMLTAFFLSVFLTHTVSYSFAIFSTGISAIILFELMPRYTFFQQFLPLSKIYTLMIFLGVFVMSIVGALFMGASFYPFIFVSVLFLFFTHIRYSNYIALSGAIFGTFFLYSMIFFPLITANSLISTLLFIFFLPLCIIANTYFWEERFPYDLKMLHYSSIAFSGLYTLYALFFIPWDASIFLYMISLSIFSLGFLLFLSYFRFRAH